jgi:hypothetical protein
MAALGRDDVLTETVKRIGLIPFGDHRGWLWDLVRQPARCGLKLDHGAFDPQPCRLLLKITTL